jgi:hypothetical protein
MWLHGQGIDYRAGRMDTAKEEQLNNLLEEVTERPTQVACLVERKQFKTFGAIPPAGACTSKTDL